MPSGNKTTDKLSDLQTGPYEVVEVEESGVDYLINKIGSSAAPIRCHIDFLNLFRTFDLPADSEPKAPVAAKSTEYAAERIMGERTHSSRLGGEVIPGRMVRQQSWHEARMLVRTRREAHTLRTAPERMVQTRPYSTEAQTDRSKGHRHQCGVHV